MKISTWIATIDSKKPLHPITRPPVSNLKQQRKFSTSIISAGETFTAGLARIPPIDWIFV